MSETAKTLRGAYSLKKDSKIWGEGLVMSTASERLLPVGALVSVGLIILVSHEYIQTRYPIPSTLNLTEVY